MNNVARSMLALASTITGCVVFYFLLWIYRQAISGTNPNKYTILLGIMWFAISILIGFGTSFAMARVLLDENHVKDKPEKQ